MAVLFWLIASACFAAEPLLSPELDQMRKEGFDALFNMDYAGAQKQFEAMQKSAPDEPAGYIYLANAVWLDTMASLRRLQTNVYNRSNAFFDEKAHEEADHKTEARFRENIGKGADLAEALLKKNKRDQKALYYMGIARNIEAGYEATVNRSFFSALRKGSKGVGYHRELAKINPSYTDAYLSLGMYEYVTGSLPFAVKILVFLGGVHGSKKDGLQMLENVAEHGNYAKDEARTLLVVLYNREKRYEDAVRVLDELAKSYPGNFLYRMERAVTLAQLDQLKVASEGFQELLGDERAMKYMGDLIHYQYAEAMFSGRAWNKALEQYRASAQAPTAPPGLRTFAHLGAGKCLDALGERDAAQAEYRAVLQQSKAMDAQDQARDYLKKPYTP